MTWQQKPNLDYEYFANGQPVAKLTWTGNLWLCAAIPPGVTTADLDNAAPFYATGTSSDIRITTEVNLSAAQNWAEGIIQ